MINENMAVIGGRAMGTVDTRRGPELWVRSAYLKQDGTEGSNKIPVLLAKEEGAKLAQDIKKGDFVVLQCALAVFHEETEEGKKGRMIGIVWNLYTDPTIVRGDGSLADLSQGNAHEGINMFRLGGYFNLDFKDKEAKLKHPKLIESNGKKLCKFDIGNQMRGGEKTSYFNMIISGASAENYVSKYLEEDDNVMVRGSIGMKKSYEKFKRPKGDEHAWVHIQTPTLWIDRFNGISKVTPAKYDSNGNSD